MRIASMIAVFGLLALLAVPSTQAIPLENSSLMQGAGVLTGLARHQTPWTQRAPAGAQFACVQPPNSCSSNSDCTCSNCCAQLGEGGPQVCQPTC
jgi:hypothetical protein